MITAALDRFSDADARSGVAPFASKDFNRSMSSGDQLRLVIWVTLVASARRFSASRGRREGLLDLRRCNLDIETSGRLFLRSRISSAYDSADTQAGVHS